MRQALALRYRPRRFEDLIGQETVSQTLSLALSSDRLAHAYLFSGLRGSGKTSTARIFAKALMCDRGPTAAPCETCENCRMSNEGRHIDIIEMDAASNRKIDDIRELIEHVKYKPSIGRYKIFIIDEVHMLTREAFNALLKTLEEPPPAIKFILATTDPLKLPPTILSRTQHFRFKKIPTVLISRHLAHILNTENIPFEPEALDLLARSGSGSLRDTITLLDQAIVYCKGSVRRDDVALMLGIINPAVIDAIFGAIFAADRQKLLTLIADIEDHDPETVVDETIATIKERALGGHDPRFTTLAAERFFRIAAESKALLAINADGGFVLTLMYLKMVEASRIASVDEAIDDLEAELFSPSSSPLTPVTRSVPDAAMPKPEPTVPAASRPSGDEERTAVPTVLTASSPSEPPHAEQFRRLVAKIYDRSYELGSCFDAAVTFVSFDAGVLTWESRADEGCKKQLRDYWGVIKHLVQEIFGVETAIKGISLPPAEPAAVSSPFPAAVTPDEQSYSTLSDIELGTSSCIAGDMPPAPEYDAQAILDDPFVKRAQELFEPKKITIIAKV